MRDLGDGQRAKARALMPEVAQIVKPTQPAVGPRAMVTAPGTMRNFRKGGAVKKAGSVTSGLGKGKPAGPPKSEPRVKSSGMKPASLKPVRTKPEPVHLAAGGVAKLRKSVAKPDGKPAALPKPPTIPKNMTPPRKRRG